MSLPVKTVFVAQLVAGQQFEDVFLVAKKSLAETKAGKPYLALTLMDRSGEVEARIWDNAQLFAEQAEEGGYVQVQAVAKPFREQMQLGISSLKRVADHAVDLADFLPTSRRPLEEMARELETVLDAINDPPLRQLLRTIFQGETLAKFQRAPAAKKMHHAYIGGLIEHTLSIVGMARRAAAHYPQLDGDMLVAGALLHDLAKIEEFYFVRPPFGYTDRGRLIGHLVLGVELIRQAAAQVAEIEIEQVDRLIHMVLSHHGQYEFGSPVLPMTAEAMLLHHFDDMDAKMNFFQELQAKMQNEGWQWSDYQRHLERYLYLRGPGEQDLSVSVPMPPPPRPRQPAPAPREPSAAPRKTPAGGQRQQTLF